MEKMMLEFIEFCFKHGGFLRNHKEFVEMSNTLLAEAIKHDVCAKESALAQTVVSRTYTRELLISVPPQANYSIVHEFDPSEAAPVFVLVYRFCRQVSKNEYAYVFAGARVQ